jgi:ribonuclease E
LSAPLVALPEPVPEVEAGFLKPAIAENPPVAEISTEDRRSRGRRDRKPPSEPPEVVMVEMTPDEQDIYAWMGISPLVLSDQEVKNPKSALISVLLPGQAPPEIVSVVAAAPVEEISAPVVSAPPAPVKLTLPPPTPKAARVVEPAAPVPEIAVAPPVIEVVREAAPAASPVPEPPAVEAAGTEEGPVRRRRRRSSAPAGE